MEPIQEEDFLGMELDLYMIKDYMVKKILECLKDNKKVVIILIIKIMAKIKTKIIRKMDKINSMLH